MKPRRAPAALIAMAQDDTSAGVRRGIRSANAVTPVPFVFEFDRTAKIAIQFAVAEMARVFPPIATVVITCSLTLLLETTVEVLSDPDAGG